MLAPTGSGSLNFEDYEEIQNKTLGDLVISGIERELLEECYDCSKITENLKDVIAITKIIGFYRWIGKAGLPGFLGITKINVDQHQLSPNESEVDNPTFIKTDYPAENHGQLRDTLDLLLVSSEKERLSVPLYANLIALRGLLDEDPSYLDFLFTRK